jgi:hypothetical protein
MAEPLRTMSLPALAYCEQLFYLEFRQVTTLILTPLPGPAPQLRHWAGDNSESEIWRLDFRLEIFSIGDVENSDTRGVPGTTSQDTFAWRLILIPIIVINVPVLAVVSAVDGLGPLGYVAGHVIDTVTIGLVL